MTTNWTIDHDYAFGGYAKRTPELDGFLHDFEERHTIVLDRTYQSDQK
ncbi:hypothetical protein [Amycolatopsis pigmentata]|uniref:Uncharacterized protein n=1 Tax=Amycolatopsis pigmentata TaxID=450801 RepID=A0ABW5FSW9_9PSEU